MQMPAKPLEVLVVEDNPADAELTLMTLKQSKRCRNVALVKDGVEAMAYLHRRDQFAGMPRPDLVLLDLNMPRKNGKEVLQEMKGDEQLKTIPVLVLTSSDNERDILGAYQLSANCYISKPVDGEKFTQILEVIEDFWLNIVKLPPKR